jgi:cell division protein ZapA (FtsZ GTPase activity inhibitor)
MAPAPELAEKKSVRLSIFNQVYSLLVSGDPGELEEAAHAVDELMTVMARAGNVDTLRIAVLACLHLQTRVQALEREMSSFRSEVDEQTRRFSSMLDELICVEAGACGD